MNKEKITEMIDFLQNKINNLPRPLNDPSRKEYYFYKNIICELNRFNNIYHSVLEIIDVDEELGLGLECVRSIKYEI